jgi:isoleucyl-tRNA synthetase
VKCGKVLAHPRVIDHVADLIGQHGTDYWFANQAAALLPAGTQCEGCGGTEFEKERDILDVWFESGVSYAAVLKSRGSGIRRICIWKARTSIAAGSIAPCWPG